MSLYWEVVSGIDRHDHVTAGARILRRVCGPVRPSRLNSEGGRPDENIRLHGGPEKQCLHSVVITVCNLFIRVQFILATFLCF